MGLISETVVIRWNPKNRIWFQSKGYKFTKWKDEFKIKVFDLSNSSSVLIEVKCDCEECENPYLKPMRWVNYLTNVKEDGKYYCRKCAKKLYGNETLRNTLLIKNGKSFEQWCIENNRQDVLDRWDYELNDLKPNEISFGTKNKYYLKCPRKLHESELNMISIITLYKNINVHCKACNSFAQWGIDHLGEDFLNKYWDYEKNTVNPWKIAVQYNKKVWIKCQEKDYHESYDISPNNFINNHRCPYCCNYHGRVHPLDSLGKLLENRGLLSLWSDKNKISPYEFTPWTSQKVYWKCPEGVHEDYPRSIASANTLDFCCSKCDYSKGEKQLDIILSEYNIPHDSQYKFTDLIGIGGRLLRFDAPVFWDRGKTELRMLIEYDGQQHFRWIKGWITKKEFKTLQHHDQLKNEYCKIHNIKLLRIPYWDFSNIESILSKELNLTTPTNLPEVVAI